MLCTVLQGTNISYGISIIWGKDINNVLKSTNNLLMKNFSHFQKVGVHIHAGGGTEQGDVCSN